MRKHSAIYVCCVVTNTRCCTGDSDAKSCREIYDDRFGKNRRRSGWHHCINCVCCKGDMEEANREASRDDAAEVMVCD